MILEGILSIVFIIIVGLIVAASYKLARAWKLYLPPQKLSNLAGEIDMPSVSVCIPARNEQHALTQCLDKVLASAYERLEIIVLDDGSADDTSALIKSYAAEGVRFVKGAQLESEWLGKNAAYQSLLRESSGSYVFFMDVDTRLQPAAIENTVRYALSHHAKMVSVLPRRDDGWRASIFFSPLRYFWELIFASRKHPAATSNAWLVRRQVLIDEFDGFSAFKQSMQPEVDIASSLVAENAYRFLISSPTFGVAYEKKWSSQLATSVRLLFPIIGRNWAVVFFVVLDLLLLIAPFGVLISAIFVPVMWLHLIAFITSVALCALYASYTARVWSKGWFIGALLFPYLLLQEIMLVLASAIGYSRKMITWKGRTIQPEVQN